MIKIIQAGTARPILPLLILVFLHSPSMNTLSAAKTTTIPVMKKKAFQDTKITPFNVLLIITNLITLSIALNSGRNNATLSQENNEQRRRATEAENRNRELNERIERLTRENERLNRSLVDLGQTLNAANMMLIESELELAQLQANQGR